MKAFISLISLLALALGTSFGQTLNKSLPAKLTKDPWTANQLINASDLVSIIQNPKAASPLIFNIGVVENIKGARNMGAASEKENLERFKKVIKELPKNSFVVIYCGCCPMERCPNIRPAFEALQTAGIKGARVLSLPTNIKVDWINKGYPLAQVK